MSRDKPRCHRFEREGLLLLEQGRPLEAHYNTCPDCRQAWASYEALTASLADGADLEPPPQWQAGVWAEIARREAAGKRRPWWGWAPVGAAAAVLLLFVVRGFLPPPATVPALSVTVVPGEWVLRGETARPGDRLEFDARVEGADQVELRLYRDDIALVLRCYDEPPCERDGSTLRAVYTLPTVGRYQALLLLSEEPLPTPTGAGLDADAGTALEAGAQVEMGEEVRAE